MSEPGAPEYKIGDVANGYVLTEYGWQPVAPGRPDEPAAPTAAIEQPPRYHVGDQANGYVLTESGWQPLPAGQPALGYQPGDVVGGYVLTESGWQPLPGARPFAAPGGGAGVGSGDVHGGAGGPQGPEATKRSKKTLTWVLAGAAAVLLVVVAGAAVVVTRAASSGSSSSARPTTTSRATGTAQSSATALTFAFGDTGTVDNRMTTSEVKIDAPVPFQPTTRFDTPDKGQFVYASVSVAATGAGTVQVDSFDFVAILPDGQRIRSSAVVDIPSSAPARLPSAKLNSGEKVVGSVAFDVPANTALKIAYAPVGQVLGTWG